MNHETPSEPEPEPLVNHYTDLSGLEGIISTKELWCTSIRHLNDGSEFHYFLKLVSELVQRHLNGPDAEAWKFILDGWPSSEAEMEAVAVGRIFVVSFSDEDDDLSQWRGYGGASGVELRFSRPELEKHLAKDRRLLWRCTYDPKRQSEQAFDDPIRYVHKLISGHIPLDRIKAGFWGRIQFLAPTFKDESFVSEAEQRIVIDLAQPHETKLPIRFRIRKEKLVPYVALPLPLITLREVLLGPTSRLADEATVRLLLKENGAEHVKVGTSRIPFR